MNSSVKPTNGSNGANGHHNGTNGAAHANGTTDALLLPAGQNLIITGYTGPNQPIIGQQVAERLKLRFVNVERQIELRAGMLPDELRARYGETRLKTVETEVMQDILLYRGTIIRVSGQTLLHGEYRRRLAETGPVVCLVVSLDAVLRRMHVSMGARYHNPHERALTIGNLKREWAVRALEIVHELDTTYLSDSEIVDGVIALWQRLAAQTAMPAVSP